MISVDFLIGMGLGMIFLATLMAIEAIRDRKDMAKWDMDPEGDKVA